MVVWATRPSRLAMAFGFGLKWDDFEEVVTRARQLNAFILRERHVNPNAGHPEIWIKDSDGYTVVIASPDGETPSDPS
jgi:hypothetical protein